MRPRAVCHRPRPGCTVTEVSRARAGGQLLLLLRRRRLLCSRAALLIALVCATPVSVSPRIVRATPQGL